jgi:hypothetical protein
VPLGEAVEAGEQLVEERDEVLGVGLVGEQGEVHDVGEEDGDLGEALGDVALAVLEALGDGLRQDVEQEALGLLLLDLKELLLLLELDEAEAVEVAEAFALKRGVDARAEDGGVDGLGQEVLCAQLDAAGHGVELVQAGGNDDGQVPHEGIVLDGLQQGEAVHRGHLHVGDEQVELPFAQGGERLLTIVDFGQVGVAERPQHHQQHGAHGVLVLRHEDVRVADGLGGLSPLQLQRLLRGQAAVQRLAQQLERAGVLRRQGRHV